MQNGVQPILPQARLNNTLGHNAIKTTFIRWECNSGREVHTMSLPYMLDPIKARLRVLKLYGRGKVTVKHCVNYTPVHHYSYA